MPPAPAPPDEWKPLIERFELHWWADEAHEHSAYAVGVPAKERHVVAVHLRRREKELELELETAVEWYEDKSDDDRNLSALRDELNCCRSGEMRDRVFGELLGIHIEKWVKAKKTLSPEHYVNHFPRDIPLVLRALDRHIPFLAWRFHVPAGAVPFAVGGQAELFRVPDNVLKRPVVVKRVKATALDGKSEDDPLRKDQERRIELEALTLAALNHSGVPAVYGHGIGIDEYKRRFLAMGWVDGKTLQEVVTAERAQGYAPRRTDPRFVALVAHLCEAAKAVAHAHDLGIVHRDLKPANILLADAGGVVVVDWGLSFWLGRGPNDRRDDSASGEHVSRATDRCGTPDFMSPEQADARRTSELSPPTDVFGLGATLVHIMTGRSVHDWASPAAIRKAVQVTKPVRPLPTPPAAPTPGDGLSGRIRVAVRHYWRVGPDAAVPSETVSAVRLTLAAHYRTAVWRRFRLAGVNEELAHICYRAVAPDPKRRFPDAGPLAEALEDWVQNAPARHPPPGVWNWWRRQRFAVGRWAQQHTRAFTLIVVGLTAVAILAGGLHHHTHYQTHVREKAKVEGGLTHLTTLCDVTAEAAPLAQQEARQRLRDAPQKAYDDFEKAATAAPPFTLFGLIPVLPAGEEAFRQQRAEARLALARVHCGCGDVDKAKVLAVEAVDVLNPPATPEQTRTQARAYFLAAELTCEVARTAKVGSANAQFVLAESRYGNALALWAGLKVADKKPPAKDTLDEARVLGYRGDCYTLHAKHLHDKHLHDTGGLMSLTGGLMSLTGGLGVEDRSPINERDKFLTNAKEDYELSLKLREDLLKAAPRDRDLRVAVAFAHNNFVHLQTIRQRMNSPVKDDDKLAVEHHVKEGMDLLEKLDKEVPESDRFKPELNAILGRAHIDRGELLFENGNVYDALMEFKQAREKFDALKENPQIEYLTGYALASLWYARCACLEDATEARKAAIDSITVLSGFPSQPRTVEEFERRYVK